MLRSSLILLLAGLPALGASPHVGGQAFDTACARCHTAHQAKAGETKSAPRTEGQQEAAPDLIDSLRTRGYEQVRAWALGPGTMKGHQLCDPRLLQPAEVDDLMAYLASRVQREPPQTSERRKQALTSEQQKAGLTGPQTPLLRRGSR